MAKKTVPAKTPNDELALQIQGVVRMNNLEATRELQAKLGEAINEANLPSELVYMALTNLRIQLHGIFNRHMMGDLDRKKGG